MEKKKKPRKPEFLTDFLDFKGMEIRIQWNKLALGYSFFIPTLDAQELIPVIHREASYRDMRLVHLNCCEQGMTGVRFWRVQPKREKIMRDINETVITAQPDENASLYKDDV